MIIDNIPLRVHKNKKTLISLNLNNYRNNHFQVNNSIKKKVHKIIRDLCGRIDDKIPCLPLELEYTIYRKDKRRIDLGNIGSIVDKYVSDALVMCGLIPDDNTDYIKAIRYIDGGIDKNCPRATLEIRHYEK